MCATVKKGSESKFYPVTDVGIEKALIFAKRKNDSAGVHTILSQKTIDRLNVIEPLFKQTRMNIFKHKAGFSSLTGQKDKARRSLTLHISHFLQVFNLGAKRDKYSFADRVLFGMNAYSAVLPGLKNDNNIREAAEKIIDGEARRLANGKPAMSNPSAAEVEAALLLFQNLTYQAIAANDAMFKEQKALRGIYKEAHTVVKKIWREAETAYSEGSRERMRKWARKWGVHYARKGGEKLVSGRVTDAATGLPVPAVKLKFKKGKNKTISRLDGTFELVTNLLKKQTLTATRPGYKPAEVKLELKEGEQNSCVVKMVKEE